jgi:hypothetical protein
MTGRLLLFKGYLQPPDCVLVSCSDQSNVTQQMLRREKVKTLLALRRSRGPCQADISLQESLTLTGRHRCSLEEYKEAKEDVVHSK